MEADSEESVTCIKEETNFLKAETQAGAERTQEEPRRWEERRKVLRLRSGTAAILLYLLSSLFMSSSLCFAAFFFLIYKLAR